MNRGLLTGLLSTTSHPTKLCENLGVLLDAEKFISLGEEIYTRETWSFRSVIEHVS